MYSPSLHHHTAGWVWVMVVIYITGSRVVPRSAAMAQTTSAVATAIAIEGENRAAKKAKRSPEVYLPLPDVSVNLRLKLCLSLGAVRLFIHILPAQSQWTRGHVSPVQDR